MVSFKKLMKISQNLLIAGSIIAVSSTHSAAALDDAVEQRSLPRATHSSHVAQPRAVDAWWFAPETVSRRIAESMLVGGISAFVGRHIPKGFELFASKNVVLDDLAYASAGLTMFYGYSLLSRLLTDPLRIVPTMMASAAALIRYEQELTNSRRARGYFIQNQLADFTTLACVGLGAAALSNVIFYGSVH